MAAAAADTTTTEEVPTTSPTPSVSPATEIRQSVTRVGAETATPHPLTYKWVMWCAKKKTEKDYEPRTVVDFSSVEQFWSLFNYLEECEKDLLEHHYTEFSFFRDGIKPKYEDDNNKDGGRIEFIFTDRREVMKYLIRIAVIIVGHQFEDAAAESICGIFFKKKKEVNEWNISIWLNTTKLKIRRDVCAKIVNDLHIPDEVEIKWYTNETKTPGAKKKFIDMRKSLSKRSEKHDESAAAAKSESPVEDPSESK